MGVYTTADKLRDKAKEHLEEAYTCLLKAADKENQWAEHYSTEYNNTLLEEALKIRVQLNKL